MKLAKDDVFVGIYLGGIALIFIAFLVFMGFRDGFFDDQLEPIVDAKVCADTVAEGAKGVQPIYRQEPEFKNIYTQEYIVLEFDLEPAGYPDWRSFKVLAYSSPELIAPAVAAVSQWQYCAVRGSTSSEDLKG
ncbi:MAG: hypothetical protein AAF862_10420, partial [Pseudomonadota bacterium]